MTTPKIAYLVAEVDYEDFQPVGIYTDRNAAELTRGILQEQLEKARKVRNEPGNIWVGTSSLFHIYEVPFHE